VGTRPLAVDLVILRRLIHGGTVLLGGPAGPVPPLVLDVPVAEYRALGEVVWVRTWPMW
jgi:hypothetical protein